MGGSRLYPLGECSNERGVEKRLVFIPLIPRSTCINMTIETLTSVFGWMTIINCGLLTIFTIAMIGCKEFVSNLHEKMLGVPQGDLKKSYFQFLANYKLVITIFNLVPYIALKIVG